MTVEFKFYSGDDCRGMAEFTDPDLSDEEFGELDQCTHVGEITWCVWTFTPEGDTEPQDAHPGDWVLRYNEGYLIVKGNRDDLSD